MRLDKAGWPAGPTGPSVSASSALKLEAGTAAMTRILDVGSGD